MNDETKCKKIYKRIWEKIKDKRTDEVKEVDNFMHSKGYTNLLAMVARKDIKTLETISKMI